MQNLQDLEGIVEAIHDRLDTAERLIRLQAQSIAHLDETNNANRAISKSIHDDFTAYKNFITGTHGIIDGHVTEQVNLLNAKIESIHASFAAYTDVIPTRIQVIEDTLTAMSMDRGPMPGHEYGTLPPPAPPGFPARQVPESFTVHTPVQPGPEVPDYVANDPWHRAIEARRAAIMEIENAERSQAQEGAAFPPGTDIPGNHGER